MSYAQMTAQSTKVQSQTISTSNLYSQQVQQQQQQYSASNVTNLYSQQQQQQHVAANQHSQQQIQSAATNQYSQQQMQTAATNQYQLQQQQQAATNQYQLQQQAATNQYQLQQQQNLNQNQYLTQTTDSYSDINTHTNAAVRTVQDTTGEDIGARALKPNFVKVPGDKEVTEGKMVRFDLRVSGRPFPDVLWYLNGHQVSDDATHKLLVNEGGVHALMITTTNRTDAGVYTCVAKNKSGETTFNVTLHVIGDIFLICVLLLFNNLPRLPGKIGFQNPQS